MTDIKNITCGYGKKPVISGLSAHFERGRLYALIGPNGCGKSTLLKSMIGIIPLMSGEIEVDGCSLSSMKQAEIAKKTAYLAQGRDIPDMSALQTVLQGRFPHLSYPKRYRECDRMLARAAMERMGIAHLEGESMRSLSGGMRQSVYIAMALCQGSECILFDEPATYLDISHTLALMRELRSLAEEGHAVVAVMHDIAMALDFADEVIVMDDGHVTAQGSPERICGSGAIEAVFGIKVEKRGERFEYLY